MDPVALKFGKLEVRWYGVFAALGFAVAYCLVRLRARTREFQADAIDQLVFWILVGGIGGARAMYVATHWSEFQNQWNRAFAVWEGGLVFYGGFIGAFAAAYIVAVVKKMPKRSLADLVAPALPLGHAFGRVGCFLNGCCYGQPYDGPFALQYPAQHYPHVAATQQHIGHLSVAIQECLPVFPVQLLNSATNLLIFVVLLLVEPRMPRKGQLFALYLMLYSTFRFSTEFLRGDYLHRTAGLTPAQFLCLILLPIGIIAFVLLGKSTESQEGSGQ